MKIVKTNSFQKKIKTYSALSVCFIAAHDNVKAQVLFTDVDPDFIFTEPLDAPQYGYVQLDFNSDSNPEMAIGFSSFTFAGSCYVGGSMSLYALNYASVMVATTFSGAKQIQLLNEGDVVSAAGNWTNMNSLTFMFSDFYQDNCDTDTEFPTVVGNWTNAIDKHMGVRFSSGGNFYYGWVRVTSNLIIDEGDTEIDTIQIFGYGYEQTPNTEILAGDGFINIPNNITEEKISATIYPNPVQQYLHIGIQQEVHGFTYSVADVQGNKILEGVLLPSLTTIDFDNLSGGIYILSVFNDRGIKLVSRKIVKQ